MPTEEEIVLSTFNGDIGAIYNIVEEATTEKIA